MIYDNIDLHNVARVLPSENGVLLDRVPASVFAQLDKPATHTSNNDSGVELRFVMHSDAVQITLRAQKVPEPTVAYLMYGNFFADWTQSAFVLGTSPTTLTIHRPKNLAHLQAVAKQLGHAFNPSVMRICLPYCRNWLIAVDGLVTPPTTDLLPKKTYLAYGSSITHGTLALNPQFTYAQQVAKQLDSDLLNFGFPGSAWLEPGLADYLVSRTDWDFASLEMGINMLGAFSVDEFSQRVDRFLRPFAADSRLVVVTDMVATEYLDDPGKVDAFRQVVRLTCERFKLPYICGLDLLPDFHGLTSDLLHPDALGMATIGKHLADFIKQQ